MNVFAIVHGDDVDGLTSGAFLKRVFDCEVYLANYDNLEHALAKMVPPYDTLYICDLNVRDQLEPELLRIQEFAIINIIDHHQMTPALKERLTRQGVNIHLDPNDCAGILVYDTFKEELGHEARRMAAYAAISDMFENGPIASSILGRMDRKFAQHEAQILTHALSADQTIDFKRKVLEELSKYAYPHRIEGAVEKAVLCLEEMTKIKESIPKNSVIVGRVAYMEAVDLQSTGGISNLLIDTLGVDIGVSYKQNGDHINFSLRGETDLPEHLGEICKRLGAKYGGFGGGHQRASGIKLPKENFDAFLKELLSELE